MTKELTTINNAIAVSEGNNESLIKIRLHPEKYPHFCKISAEQKYQMLRLALLNCYKLRHANDLSYIDSDCAILMRKIDAHRDYRELTMQEISAALTNGATGDYGECYSMTVEFCLKCLARYIRDNESSYLEAKRIRLNQNNNMDEARKRVLEMYAASMARAARERLEAEKKGK